MKIVYSNSTLQLSFCIDNDFDKLRQWLSFFVISLVINVLSDTIRILNRTTSFPVRMKQIPSIAKIELSPSWAERSI